MIIKRRFTSSRVRFSPSHCHSSHSLCRTKVTTTLLLSTTCWSNGSRPTVAASPWNSGSMPASDDQAPLLNRQLSRCVRRFQRLLKKHKHPRFSDQSSSIQRCKKETSRRSGTLSFTDLSLHLHDSLLSSVSIVTSLCFLHF